MGILVGEEFFNLKVNNKVRANELSFKILSSNGFESIWDICVDFLSQYRAKEVEDLFINILVEYDCIGYDNIKNIIDNYFNSTMVNNIIIGG